MRTDNPRWQASRLKVDSSPHFDTRSPTVAIRVYPALSAVRRCFAAAVHESTYGQLVWRHFVLRVKAMRVIISYLFSGLIPHFLCGTPALGALRTGALCVTPEAHYVLCADQESSLIALRMHMLVLACLLIRSP